MKTASPAPLRPKKRPRQLIRRAPGADLADMRFVLDEAGCFAYVSPAFAVLAGTTAEILKGAPASRTLASADPRVSLSSLSSGVHELTCGGSNVEFRFDSVAGPDGRAYVVASAPSAVERREANLRDMLFHAVGDAANIVTDAESVSPIGASATLREPDIRHFFSMSDDMMCTTHPDGGISRFNAAFARILGYGPQDMIGKMFVDFVDPADKPAVRNALYGLCGDEDESAGSGAPSVRFDCRMMSASGEARWTSWIIRRDEGVLYCLGRDTTESLRYEAALMRREQQLSEAQALAHMGHWRWDVGSSDIEWSSELYNIFGVNRSTFTPTMDSINALIHRRDLGRLYQAFQRAIIQQNDYDMDFRVIRPDGHLRIIRCEGRCEMDSDGEVIALYGIMQDITPQKEHERALREAKESAEAAYASKSRFLANMSHELRTPLNAIIGFSDLMDKQILGPLGNERYLDYVQAIRESGKHLLDLITDILDMSKIEAGKYELTLQDVNVSQVVRTAAQMMEARAQEGGIDLSLQLPDEDVVIRADRRALKQIVLNLLSNAVKFTDGGGRVSAGITREDRGIVINVSDSGIGIPAHKLADVTKPFEQVSNAFTRGHEGSGLGLAITKDLTELHGGTLSIESRLGVGTTVMVHLPVA